MNSEEQRLFNFKRNDPALFERYMKLPVYNGEMEIKCPKSNMDGTPAQEICGCGSDKVVWSGDMYDCPDCGIFFSDFAANPPHRRRQT